MTLPLAWLAAAVATARADLAAFRADLEPIVARVVGTATAATVTDQLLASAT